MTNPNESPDLKRLHAALDRSRKIQAHHAHLGEEAISNLSAARETLRESRVLTEMLFRLTEGEAHKVSGAPQGEQCPLDGSQRH